MYPSPAGEMAGLVGTLALMVFLGVLAGLEAIQPGLAFLFIFWVALVMIGIATAFTLKIRGPKRAALCFGAWSLVFAVVLAALAYRVAGTRGLLVAAIQIADMADYVLAVALIAFMAISRGTRKQSSDRNLQHPR